MTAAKKRENPLISLVLSVALPMIILIKFANDEYLGSTLGFWVALSFPIAHGVYELVANKNKSVIAVLGVVNVMLTGGVKLLELGGYWFAAKEAAVPAVIGFAILLTQKSKTPLVRTMLYNDQILNIERIEKAVEETNSKVQLDKLLQQATFIIFASFMFSAVVNFALAAYLVTSPPNTSEFNEQIGKMTGMSMVVIAVPCTLMLAFALYRFGTGLRKLTKLEWQDILNQQ
jgi:hypothetical protein